MKILSIENLIDDKKCYEMIRELRWRENGFKCPHCNAVEIIKRGKDDKISIIKDTNVIPAPKDLMISQARYFLDVINH